ncbi:MAG: hypothetical protein GWO08_06060 [Gammaproteobacteria bacterium]|nr:hypothetical protein [Phycisphaerae bacterium]NIR93240.1 hypothetical protein [Gammaproteobacteria bacterium]NIW48886.1 hypothetical protein [Gammaproteobacteria bacterium]
MISRWVVGVAVLFGILLLMLPKTDEQSLAKIASASMLMCTQDFRKQVTKQTIRGEVVSAVFRNGCPDLIASLKVNQQGHMVIVGKKHNITMALTPALDEGKVRWSCQGEPQAFVTNLCKP